MSAFTHFLVEGISRWQGRSPTRDGEITVESLYDYAERRTQQEALLQHPEIRFPKGRGGKIVIAWSPKTDEKSWKFEFSLAGAFRNTIEQKRGSAGRERSAGNSPP